MGNRITIADIAREAKVAKSTVSFVLNKKKGQVPISDATRERVMRVVRAYNYQSNPIAQALVTKRTGHLGFILSDDMAGGFENMFFAACLSGAEAECRREGYNLSVSLYNLSCLDSFICPASVNQRSVDGVILAGYIADGVMAKFKEADIPCVCIGDYTERAEAVTAVTNDIIAGNLAALDYAVGLGHRNILVHSPTRHKDMETVEEVRRRFARRPGAAGVRLEYCFTPEHLADYSAAEPLAREFFALPERERPTMLIACDQTSLALLKELGRRKIRVPEDVSLISMADTVLCEMATPGVTSLHFDLPRLGARAVKLLLDCIRDGRELPTDPAANRFPGRIVERDSCRRLK